MLSDQLTATYKKLGKTLPEILDAAEQVGEPDLIQACKVAILLYKDIGEDMENLSTSIQKSSLGLDRIWLDFLTHTYTQIRDLGGDANMVCLGAISDGASEAEITNLLMTLFDLSPVQATKLIERLKKQHQRTTMSVTAK